MAEAVLTPSAATRTGRRRRRIAATVPWLFLAIPLFFALFFKVWPAIDGLLMSLHKVQPLLGDEFIGLRNYERLFQDDRFIGAIGNTLFLAVFQTGGAAIVGLLLALLLEGTARKLQIARSVVFLPVVTAVAVIGEMWRLVYAPAETGLLNSVLSLFGIETQQFLADPHTALAWVGVMGIWTGAPYNMLIFLAGLVGVDRSLYEAAAVDGATTWHRLIHVTLPSLRASLSVVLTLSAVRGLRIFTEVFVLTGGGPAGSTETWMTRVYSLGFGSNDIGLASAAATILLIVTIVLTVLTRWLSSRKLAQS